MGAARPRAEDVARRLAAAIAMAGTLLVALVVPLAPAAAGSPVRGGAATARALAAAPAQAWLESSREHGSVPVSAQRGQDEVDASGALAGVLLARTSAFFVGLTDSYSGSLAGRPVPGSRGRSPPSAAVLAPR